MSNKSQKLSDVLQRQRILINNSLSDPTIADRMAQYGYPAEVIQQAKAILNDAEDLYSQQKKEYGEYHEATSAFYNARDEFHEIYNRDLKFARIALINKAATLAKIGASGERFYSISKYIEQAKTFYKSFVDDAELVTAMSKFGYTLEHFQNQYNIVNEFNGMLENSAKEQGDAQQATKARDAKMDELLSWASIYRKVAFLAFEDDAQYLEKLGILVRS